MKRNKFKCILLLICRVIPDKIFISLEYYYHFHKFPNFDNPVTFSEKLQWLKLYDRNPKYTLLVDKYRVKEIVAKIIGKEYIVPTIGVWRSPSEIDFNSLPNQFVLKWNHDSGSIIICKNKNNINLSQIKKQLMFGKLINGYYSGREWPYKNVVPCIIAEPLLCDEIGSIVDYKFYCFKGVPKFIVVITDRFSSVKYSFYDMNFNFIPVSDSTSFILQDCFVKPEYFKEMENFASKLSEGFPHVRVDFIGLSKTFYFSELTFYDCSGFVEFSPDDYNYLIGSWLSLPVKTMK